MAYLRGAVGTRQMRPGSRALRHLDEQGWGAVEVHSLWSPLDLVVIPATSSRLDAAHNRAMPVALHPWMATDTRVLEAICEVLAE